jgi:signal transduction histidine kinase
MKSPRIHGATQGDSSPQVPGLYLWLWLAVALAGLHSLLTVFGFGAWRLELGSLARLLTAPISAGVMLWLGFRMYRRGRASTLWLAVATIVWWFGDAAYGYVEVIARIDPNTVSLLGYPYLGAVFCMIVAVAFLPRPKRSTLEAISLWCETLIVIVASISAMWRGFIVQNLVDQKWNLLSVVFDLIGPFVGMGVLGFLFLTVLRQRERILAAYNWLSVGVLCFAGVLQGADFIRAQGSKYFTGHPIDALSSWGNVFLLTAVLFGIRPRAQQNRLLVRIWSSALTAVPYLAVVVSYGLMFTFMLNAEENVNHPIIEMGLLIGVGLVTALVVVRQLLMILENRNLNNSLEHRVLERGQELEVSQARLNASERLASLGQLTAGLAHEVNTPLATAMNGVSQAQGLAREYRSSIGNPGVTDDDHREIAGELEGALSQVEGTLKRLGELIRKMRAQGRNPNDGAVRFSPVKTAQDALVMLDHAAMQAKVELVFETNPELESILIHGDPVRFAQVVTNLVQNAIHACEDRRRAGGSRVRLYFSHDQDYVTLHVSDNGSGIPEHILPQIFDPLFTTKAAGRGTGLGLAIIKDIVTSHFAGQIDCETQPSNGTTFNVRLNRIQTDPTEFGSVPAKTQTLELDPFEATTP